MVQVSFLMLAVFSSKIGLLKLGVKMNVKSTRGGGVTCICRDTGICHYFGYFWGVAFGYSRIFGYHFLIKFDFFQNNPDFGVSILIFPSMTLWNVACKALVSMILQFSFCSIMLVKSVQSALSALKRPLERLQSQCKYRPFIT